MVVRKRTSSFSGEPIQMGDFLQVEFENDDLRWVIVNEAAGPTLVRATILEEGSPRWKQGRAMNINLKKWVRQHRTKNDPPPLWGLVRPA